MVAGQVCQIAMCTTDLTATTRIFTDVFGFASAGGRPLWGHRLGLIQDLPTGADSAAVLWWMVGRQDFVQLEIFMHSNPPIRPRPAGWQPSDIGWNRWGVAVANFDVTLDRLAEAGLRTITDPIDVDGLRRVCFREPGADVVVEIMEDGEAFPGGRLSRYYDLSPAVSYAAVSVTDLDRARQLYTGAMGMTELASDTLHRPEHEAMWGLSGADRECAVFKGGDVLIEVSRYLTPSPRPVADDFLLSDQGMMNAAVGYRWKPEVMAAYDASLAMGLSASNAPAEVAGGTYLRLDDRLSLELLVGPRELDAEYGFAPIPRFPRPLIWPTPID
ncbi:MAG: hypothetical protein JWM76_504 [Pseudonocardiales bacterium]|nr:hypothetical protein [Pseudonocardiales bacterium]